MYLSEISCYLFLCLAVQVFLYSLKIIYCILQVPISCFKPVHFRTGKKMGWFLCRNATLAYCVVLSHCLSLDFPILASSHSLLLCPLALSSLWCSLLFVPFSHLSLCLHVCPSVCRAQCVLVWQAPVCAHHPCRLKIRCFQELCLQDSAQPPPCFSRLCTALLVSAILPHLHTVNVMSLGLETCLPPSFSIRLYVKQMLLCR